MTGFSTTSERETTVGEEEMRASGGGGAGLGSVSLYLRLFRAGAHGEVVARLAPSCPRMFDSGERRASVRECRLRMVCTRCFVEGASCVYYGRCFALRIVTTIRVGRVKTTLDTGSLSDERPLNGQ